MSSNNQRLIRRQLLKNAEGYLELATVFDDRWPLPQELRFALAHQAMASLALARPVVDDSDSGLAEAADISFLRGLSFELLEQYEDAVEQLSRSLEVDHLQAEAYSHLAWCYRQLKKCDMALTTVTHGLRYFPRNAIFYYNAACYSCLSKNFDDSIHYLRQAIRLDLTLVKQAEAEEDFQLLRNDSRFQALMEKPGSIHEQNIHEQK